MSVEAIFNETSAVYIAAGGLFWRRKSAALVGLVVLAFRRPF
jgi:hypothetical protein